MVSKIGVPCPKCSGDVIVKKTKKGREFYGCSQYPACTFVSWNQPTTERCPQCGEVLFKKKGKLPKLFCAAEGCGYEREDDTEEAVVTQEAVVTKADA